MTHDDPFQLKRFMDAQEPAYTSALSELCQGQKQSHWMWFIFPQLKGLGRSPAAQYYGLASLQEARAYLGHPILGQRLREATQAVIDARAVSLRALFGSPDDMKFRSSMTLFEKASDAPLFAAALDRWCNGERDDATLRLLSGQE